MAEQLDPRLILTGVDGELYSEDGQFLAQVNTFQAQISFTNVTYRPGGSRLEVAIPDIYSVTLTLTETVIRDATLLKKLMDSLKDRTRNITFGFQGVLRGRDGTTHRTIFRSCVPDGAIDLISVAPGDALTRSWSFRVNEPPDLQELLGG